MVFRMASAGGQLEQPWLVNNSMTVRRVSASTSWALVADENIGCTVNTVNASKNLNRAFFITTGYYAFSISPANHLCVTVMSLKWTFILDLNQISYKFSC